MSKYQQFRVLVIAAASAVAKIGRISKVSKFSRLTQCGLILAAMTGLSLLAQDPSTRVYGPEDQDVPLPRFSPLTGQKDQGAVQEIQSFITAAGLSSWTGIQAVGTYTPAANSQQSGQSVTVTISGKNDSRLDITTPAGTRSIRIHGRYEEVLNPDGTRHSVPFLAAKAGFIGFPRLLDTTISVTGLTVIDGGIVTVAGKSLHRVTVEEPLRSAVAQATAADTSVLDFYFDPNTHLLVKSAVDAPISWSDRERYFVVVSYGDYQSANGLLLPLEYSETLNGQPVWSLQLTSVNPLPSLEPSYFHF